MTENGFVNIEDIKVGDKVITPKNTIEIVEDVWHQGIVDIYRVTFQDGREIECCGDHLWQYHLAGQGTVESKVSNTKKLFEIVSKDNARAKGLRKYLPITPLCVPLDLKTNYEKLPFNPYVMGLLLGDGHINVRGHCTITSMDEEIFSAIEAAGYTLGTRQIKPNNKASSISILGVAETFRDLGLAGSLSQTKFIPQEFIQASIEDRFSLVQGLMDTDGYISAEGSTYFDTTSEQLADGMTTILQSLGFTAKTTTKIGSYRKDGVKVLCSKVYKLYIRGVNTQKLFRLSRKVSRCLQKPVLGNKIVDIQKVEPDFATCIGISGDDKLFITTNYIVTHNSRICLTKNLDGIHDPDFRCTIFRRTYPELKRQGGLIDESKSIYPDFKGVYKTQANLWMFPSGASIAFSVIATDDDLNSWQGSQLTRALIDEAADKWTEKQVLFLLSRLRSSSKIHPQLLMSCNPDIGSFLKRWVDFCLDENGVPVAGTENKIRWMFTMDNRVYWADSAEESFKLYGEPRGMVYARGMSDDEIRKHPPDKLFMPLSFRFIPTGVFDNPYLLPPKNTSYLPNLLAQPYVNQLRYLHGSWTAKEAGTGHFKREWTPIVDVPPTGRVTRVRSWDFANTEKPEGSTNRVDATVGVKVSRDSFGIYYIEDVVRVWERTDKVLKTVIETAFSDGLDECTVTIPKDPGAAGAMANSFFARTLAEHGVGSKSCVISGHSGKVTRFMPFSSLCQANAVRVVRGDWNDAFFNELEQFTGGRNELNDQADATSDAINTLCKQIQMPTFVLPTFSAPSPIPTI